MANRSYSEFSDSQLPALRLLRKTGYTWLPAQTALKYRDGLTAKVILEPILTERLQAINSFEYKGKKHQFSAGSIEAAIFALRNVPDEGLLRTNQKIYELLTMGKSFPEQVGTEKKSFTLKYIDWENINNNHFHITEEYQVSGLQENRRPDLILFVNGIPLVVIENKRRDKPFSVKESISQQLRNQKEKEGIPKLFHYAQMLLAVEPNEVKYATVGTKAEFWSVWQEETNNDAAIQSLLHAKVNTVSADQRLVTEQDRVLYNLCRPERLLELMQKYIVFDAGNKKVARYQQYFAVQSSLSRIRQRQQDGSREGGVIWHTQGSGKSLTMVMLSKAIRLSDDIKNPRVVVVTDRISLDKQIHTTFHQCGILSLAKAKSGADLADLLTNSDTEVITTITDKFDTALKKGDFCNDSSEIFVLVDESHRSQYGLVHSRMKKVLPNACYIGFTGTPLLKKDKNTAKKFGGYIHVYSIEKAVQDKAVLPLLYEGRSAKLSVNKSQLDRGFERITEPLNEYETRDFKKKFARISKIYETQQVIEEIAHDISEHFCENWQGTGFKAQLAVTRIDTAVKYQKYFEQQTNPKLKINTAVIFTPPDSREGHTDVWTETKAETKKYWDSLMTRYSNREDYEKHVIDSFKDEGSEVEIIIVVSKLLTGFDAPRNTVLYLAKPLSDHTLLQAIARVNRLFEGKEHGFIIDYVGILGKLDKALNDYGELDGFEEEDIAGAMTNVLEEIRKVPHKYSAVWTVFKVVKNVKDIEELERHLAEQNVRDDFYEKLTAFGRALQTALSTDEFYKEYDDTQIRHWLREMKFFKSLKVSVQKRYAEVVDYDEYEARVKKLLDTHVSVDEVEKINEPINIFDEDLRMEEMVKRGENLASIADTIAHQMKKTATERMDEDPILYLKFSELIEAAISAFRENRLSETEYLTEMLKIKEDFKSGGQNNIPASVKDNSRARALYSAIKKTAEGGDASRDVDQEKLAKAGLSIDLILQDITTVDWKMNPNKPLQIANGVEDYLLENREDIGVDLSFAEIDDIIALILKIAKSSY